MFKKLLLLFNGFLLITLCFCQTPISSPILIASGGEFFKINNSYSLSYTIGEVSIKTLSKGNYILTEGFQQGNPHYPAPVIKDIFCMPNPVDDYLTILFNVDDGLSFTVQVFSVIGKAVDVYEYSNVLTGDRHELDFKKYAKGLYLVKVQSRDGKIQRTFKIEKI